MEFANEIITKSGELITVKWFNSMINEGGSGTFSVGLPLSRDISKEDSIDSIRAFWKDKLEQDRTTIQALKNIVFNGESR